MLIDGNLSYGGISIVSILSAGVGAYFGAYLKKKGENIATKEDFNDLKEQTRQLTHATKEIEARISDESWDRQRGWELKRDLLLRMVVAMQGIDGAASLIASTLITVEKDIKNGEPLRDGFFREAAESWEKAKRLHMEAAGAVTVVASEALLNKLAEFERVALIVENIPLHGGASFADDSCAAMMKLSEIRTAIILIVRYELHLNLSPIRSRSNESLATPTPGSQVPATDKPEHH